MIDVYYCYHALWEMRYHKEKSPKLWFENREESFAKIAELNIKSDPTGRGELERIYKFLQNGETPWMEHPKVKFLGGFPRSMCEGDVLVFPELEIAYMCSHFGFVKL